MMRYNGQLHQFEGYSGSTPAWGAIGGADFSSVTENILPDNDDSRNLGSSTKRWANVYTADAHFNNVGTGGNEVDGTEGHWTMQEGSDSMYLINRITGKKFKIAMTEVS